MSTLDSLMKEYRPTMGEEVLHSWAKDVVAEYEKERQRRVEESWKGDVDRMGGSFSKDEVISRYREGW